MTGKVDKVLLTVQQVMSRLQVSDETVYRHIRAGDLHAVKVGRQIRISPESLNQFVVNISGSSKKKKQTEQEDV